MDTNLLIEKFQRMGARLKVGELRPSWRPPGTPRDGDGDAERIAVDIRRDEKGEYFDVRLSRDAKLDLDVIDVRPKSQEMTPFIIARETQGERPVPAWLEVLPGQLRILVHQLPVRQQIDTPVQEQLIVELYSK